MRDASQPPSNSWITHSKTQAAVGESHFYRGQGHPATRLCWVVLLWAPTLAAMKNPTYSLKKERPLAHVLLQILLWFLIVAPAGCRFERQWSWCASAFITGRQAP